MIPNDDLKLKEQLKKIWRESQERLVKTSATTQTGDYLDLTHAPIELDGLKLVDQARAEEAGAVVFEHKGHKAALGALHPDDPKVKALIDELKAKGFELRIFVVSKESLEYALSFYQFIPKRGEDIVSKVGIGAEEVSRLKKELVTVAKVGEALTAEFSANQIATKKIMEILLAGALNNRASDIHLESGEENSKLRYRIDGVLQIVVEGIPEKVYHLVVSRIKLLSNLRINISSEKQDGRFTIDLDGVNIEMRVSVVPAEFGEAIVMRILDPSAIRLSLTDMGIRPDDLEIMKEEINAPNGMILNTGPTGSGKTTTLYAFLRTIADSETKVITIEDPIEYHLDMIEQTQVNPARGYTFASGLSALMRQDPDAILVGEIRDKETADIAIQAALTGHLVFSTIHANSAAGAVPRLLALGVKANSIGPALNLAIAQRLVRRICKECRVAVESSDDFKTKVEAFYKTLPERAVRPKVEEIKIFNIKQDGDKKGCEKCNFSGYKGRVGIFELLRVDKEMEKLITETTGEATIEESAIKAGMVTMMQDGVLRVLSGETTFEEVEAVAGKIEGF
ncbi:MAG: hypothetical protein COU10_00145 [Candidatus Harrisonbacteria bacterium CG10_big_fil_rev_8_21_14_0_10_45_28]|uniref:Bacterial type II secretion system protein E domain-containing protein n=1 Tax=Candidatus Harrisonbacteria bacterium CG10_big_fil_rev_8_21_14_0_10_45_28 TaxID=1974586 RepID=A0A2H0UPE3_9BACT|nr:MAG: hypothetical protein COU10_00145 [Candidatus Harrisonbacteria bacterium CG10_big_fil_rev_8_21_14_0_10_45_28]